MLQARHRICLSGTPMENHLGEVWGLFEFLLPGYLSSETRFKTLFRTPIEKHGDSARLALLRRRLAPFMLRRTKDMVATELPPKVETVVRVQFDAAQANLYETIRLSTEASVREALAEKGLARSHIMVLDALLKLSGMACSRFHYRQKTLSWADRHATLRARSSRSSTQAVPEHADEAPGSDRRREANPAF
jgi:SNF2 family DNA or RNA helicase